VGCQHVGNYPAARQIIYARYAMRPVIRELERTTDPLFRQAGILLD
jgi:hypothetical protein